MNPIIKKNGINWGIGLGLFSILYTTLIYAFGLYSSWLAGVSVMLIGIVLYVLLVYNTKKQLNGIISFKEAFTVFFIAALISAIMGTVYTIVLYNFIDPSAKEIVKEESVKAAVSIMEKMGTPASEINKAVDKMEDQDNYSVQSQLMGFVIGLCVSSVIGLLLALIFKSRPQYKE